MREWQSAPCELLEDIVAYRGYARAKQIVDAATRRSEIPSSPLMELVQDVEFGLVRAERERRQPQRE